MIGKAGKALRGARLAGLLYYLFGPGQATAHHSPRIIAAWNRNPSALQPESIGSNRNGWPRRNFRDLIAQMERPLRVAGESAPDKPVWHCVLEAAPEDPVLGDEAWARIAHETIDRLGFSATDGRDGLRWIAVRHEDRGIHLTAVLARENGAIPDLANDFWRIRESCRWAEQTYGLRVTDSGERTAARRPTRAETEKAARRGVQSSARDMLRSAVRTAAVAASDPAEFAGLLEQSGVLCQFRYSTTSTGKVTGYKVALPQDTTAEGNVIWYSGRALARDLTWPKLSGRWPVPPIETGIGTAGEVEHRVEVYEATAGNLAEAVRTATTAGPQEVIELAAAADDLMLSCGSAQTGPPAPVPIGHPLHHAADSFARLARASTRSVHVSTELARSLRRQARMILLAGRVGDGADLAAWLALAAQLAALAEAVAAAKHASGAFQQATIARRSATAWRTITDVITRQAPPPGAQRHLVPGNLRHKPAPS